MVLLRMIGTKRPSDREVSNRAIRGTPSDSANVTNQGSKGDEQVEASKHAEIREIEVIEIDDSETEDGKQAGDGETEDVQQAEHVGQSEDGEQTENSRREDSKQDNHTSTTPLSIHAEGKKHDNQETGDDAILRHNAEAIDHILEENAIRYPRLANQGGTGHQRAGLSSNLWDDIKKAEWNAGHDWKKGHFTLLVNSINL